MRILIAGCWRSGTTAIYNLARVICEEQGTVYCCFEDTYNESEGGKHDYEIVKVHKYKESWADWADCVITIFREPDEVLRSMKRFEKTGGRKLDISDLLRGLAYWGFYQQHTDLCLNYSQLIRSPEKTARLIAQAIGLIIESSAREVVRKWMLIKPPKNGVDSVTLLHHNHITKNKNVYPLNINHKKS